MQGRPGAKYYNNKIVQSSQQSSDQICFCTNTRTTHTRQNKPYRLGVVPAGVVGARGRCCPASTVPVAVVFACGVCCCIAVEIQNKSSTEKQSSAIIVHKAKRTATSTRTKNVCSERLRAAGGRDIVSYTHVICSALL